MKKALQAMGKHYFTATHCPISVMRVSAGIGPQHEHDLTDLAHYHDFAELVVITDGRGLQIIDQVEYPVIAGDVFLLQGFTEHFFRERHAMSLMNIQYAPALLPLPLALLRQMPGYNVMFQLEPNLRTRRTFKHRLHLEAPEIAELIRTAESLREELRHHEPGFETAALTRLLEIITFVSRRYTAIHADNRAALVRMGEVISRLETDFAAPWTLPKIAKCARTSPNNLLRLFKAATGDSPMDYLRKVRLQRAAEQLCATDRNITEIAFACGFNDPDYFTRRFTIFYGVSPRAYRRIR